MLILSALIPLSLTMVFLNPKLKNGLQILSLAVSLGFLIFEISTKSDVALIGPCVFILLILAHQKFFKTQLSVFEIIAVTFAAQAFLLTKTNQVLLLAIISESLFFLSQGNFKAHLRQAVSWLPITVAIVLNDHGNLFIALSAVTIILKSFQWPINLEGRAESSKLYQLVSRVVLPLAIWKTFDVPDPLLWASFWMAIPLFFSWGTSFRQMMVPVMLAMWTLSHEIGALGMVLWALFLLEGLWMVAGVLAVGTAGLLVTKPVPGLTQEMEYVFLVLQGFSLARVAVAELRQKPAKSRGYYLSLLFISICGGAVLGYFETLPLIGQEIGPLIFAGSLVGFTVLCWFLYKSKEKFFMNFKSVNPLDAVFHKIETAERYTEKKHSETVIREFHFLNRLLEALDKEAYLIVLIGIGACFLLWGVL